MMVRMIDEIEIDFPLVCFQLPVQFEFINKAFKPVFTQLSAVGRKGFQSECVKSFRRASVRGVPDGHFRNAVFNWDLWKATGAELRQRRRCYAYKKYVQQVSVFVREVKHLLIDE